MALHTQLPIYKVSYDLLDVITDLAKNMPRDFKASIGGKLRDECIDFVGHVIKPWHTTTRRRTVNEAVRRIGQTPTNELLEVGNSYFGLLRQSTHSHHNRARLANALRRRGHSIKSDLTQTYRRSA